MVKYTITLEDGTEITKFSCKFNTYGVGEELLHPVQVNDSLIGQPQPETNLATYLIKFQEFKKSNVEIKRNGNKAWLFYTSKYNKLQFIIYFKKNIFTELKSHQMGPENKEEPFS